MNDNTTLSSEALRALKVPELAKLDFLEAERGPLVRKADWKALAAIQPEVDRIRQHLGDLDAGIALAEQEEQARADAEAAQERQRIRAGIDEKCRACLPTARAVEGHLRKAAAGLFPWVAQTEALQQLAPDNPGISTVTSEAMRRVLQAFVNAMPPGFTFPTRTPFALPADPLETLLPGLSAEFDRANPPPGAAE